MTPKYYIYLANGDADDRCKDVGREETEVVLTLTYLGQQCASTV